MTILPPVIDVPLLYGGRNGQGEDGGGGWGWGVGGNCQRGGSADALPPPRDGAGPLPHGIDTFILYEGRIGWGEYGGGGQGTMLCFLSFLVSLATLFSPSSWLFLIKLDGAVAVAGAGDGAGARAGGAVAVVKDGMVAGTKR